MLVLVASLHTPLTPMEATASLVLKLATIWPVLLYFASAYGLGRVLAPFWRGAQPENQTALQLTLGLVLLLSLDQVLGIVGLLNRATAIGFTLLGLGLAIDQLVRRRVRACKAEPESKDPPSLLWILAIPGLALLIVASLMPPGWLWASEFGGFDALSYHLDLPQQWIRLGRIVPLQTNVYSFLPGFLEGAFVHLGMMTWVPKETGLLAGDGWRLISCQTLEAGFAILAAWLTCLTTTQLGQRLGASDWASRLGGLVAGALLLSTPWAIVTGSLAYNEAAVNAMLTGGLLISLQSGITFPKRCALAGLLVGLAISLKLTSVFFVSLPVGCVLLAGFVGDTRETNTRFFSLTLCKGIAAGVVATLLVMLPWLVRNAAVSGNPVFPFAASIFGSGHWTSDQLSRFMAGHHFDGSLLDRLRLLFLSDPHARAGMPTIEVFRGFANPQWGVFLPALAIAFLGLARRMLVPRATQEKLLIASLCLGMLAQMVAWLWLTHLQSRFLLPMLPTGAVVIGLAIARSATPSLPHAAHSPHSRTSPDSRETRLPRGWFALCAGIVLIAIQTSFAFGIYAAQHVDPHTNLGRVGVALAWFPDIFTGRLGNPPDRTAVGWVNTFAKPDARVYLEGDTAGLYFGPNAVVHTTWDNSLLGDLARQYPDDPAAWVRELHTQKIAWILVNPNEIDRFRHSGWYDPLITNAFVYDFAQTLGGAARVWPEEGRYLIQISPPPTSPTNPTSPIGPAAPPLDSGGAAANPSQEYSK